MFSNPPSLSYATEGLNLLRVLLCIQQKSLPEELPLPGQVKDR